LPFLGDYLSDLTLILLAAGEATRFARPVKKQWLRIGTKPLWLHVAEKFTQMSRFEKIVVAGHADEIGHMRAISDLPLLFVEGGASRQASLKNALFLVDTPLVMVSDIARPCVSDGICDELVAAIAQADCAVPTIPVTDTVYYKGAPVDRSEVLRIQTPQLSRTEKLLQALETGKEFTDESSAIAHIGGRIAFVGGDEALHKLTFKEDLSQLPCLEKPDTVSTFTGSGFDVHAFEPNRRMVLGGVTIDVPYGFKAHSDGDVAIHALIDALMGAAGMGDIGEHFPDTDAKWAGADSAKLLRHIVHKIYHFGYDIVHADVTIMAQKPKISPYKEAIRRRLAELLSLPPERVNVKATTTERLGFVGREEGVAVQATATLRFFDWSGE
jgi:2-C-methyl-D-erythritol 4-phosphate cytidylyltransferase/2-C-methyl-D-erythritol 2,4-cyclodiphosphate synthase